MWKKILLGCLLFISIERFCYYQTGTFALPKMIHKGSPPSPTSSSSSIHLEQPLHFLGAGKQFFAFETADKKYVVKFMKWSRRRPLPWLPNNYLIERAQRAANLQKSSLLALNELSQEAQLLIPAPTESFTLIDKLGISHTVPSDSVHFYVQKKADNFTDYFSSHLQHAEPLLHSFIQTVASQCRKGIANLDPITQRNFGVVEDHVILLDFGSLLADPKLHHTSAIHHEIVLELLPLRAYLQQNHPEHVPTFDKLLTAELASI